MRKPKLTNNDKAAARVEAAIEAGHVLVAYAPLKRCNVSVGTYHEAFDKGVRYAVIGYSGADVHRGYKTALDAAYGFVGYVGSTRAREAAIKALKNG